LPGDGVGPDASSISSLSLSLSASVSPRDTQLQGLQTSLTSGSYSGVVSGLVYDRVKRWPRAGPRVVILIGCVCNFVGYFLFWQVGTGRLTGIPYETICAFSYFAGFGTTWFDTSVMATSIHNLKEESGMVIGALKSFVGLGAGMSTQFFKAYFQDRPLDFLLAQAMGPTAVASVVCIFTNLVPHRQAPSQDHTRRACKVAIATASTIVVMIFLSTFIPDLNEGEGKVAWVWLLLGTFVPFLLSPLYTGGLLSVKLEGDEDDEDHLLQRLTDPTDPGAGKSAAISGDDDGLTFGQSMRRLDFWLLWIVFGSICGCGLTLLHNLGQIVPAYTDGKQTSCTVFVQLFSLMNCCGRLGAGYLSQHALSAYGVPRTLFLMLPGLLLGCDFILMNFITIDMLWVPVVIGGLAFGMNWALVPSILCDGPFFGTRAFASNYNVITLSSVFGDFLLSTALSGRLYDYERRKQNNGTECYGKVCFRQTFNIVSGVAFFTCFVSLALYLRSRRKYKEL